jgi:hypothetical protein
MAGNGSKQQRGEMQRRSGADGECHRPWAKKSPLRWPSASVAGSRYMLKLLQFFSERGARRGVQCKGGRDCGAGNACERLRRVLYARHVTPNEAHITRPNIWISHLKLP